MAALLFGLMMMVGFWFWSVTQRVRVARQKEGQCIYDDAMRPWPKRARRAIDPLRYPCVASEDCDVLEPDL